MSTQVVAIELADGSRIFFHVTHNRKEAEKFMQGTCGGSRVPVRHVRQNRGRRSVPVCDVILADGQNPQISRMQKAYRDWEDLVVRLASEIKVYEQTPKVS